MKLCPSCKVPKDETEFGPNKSREKVVAEIAKCELICANCHRERTVFRMREAA